MSNSFSQSRKKQAATVEDAAREILARHFGVATEQVVSVESQLSGRYDTSTISPVKLLDFACVDWLVDERPRITPVAQRITPEAGSARFSIRTENGSNMPCEADVLAQNGLVPTHYLFGWREDTTLTRAWILDAQDAYKTVMESAHTNTIHNDDGTAAMYLDIGELAKEGCIIEGYDL